MNHFPVLVHSKCGIWNHIQIASKIPAIQIVHYRALLLSGCYFVCFSKFLYCNAFCMRNPCLVLFFYGLSAFTVYFCCWIVSLSHLPFSFTILGCDTRQWILFGVYWIGHTIGSFMFCFACANAFHAADTSRCILLSIRRMK